jgi:hypothetical protein
VVLIRNPFGPGWHATVDGRSVAVTPGDFVDQAMAVPAGHHVIQVRFDDPSIGWGLLGTVIALALLLGLAGAATMRARRREGEGLGMDFAREPEPTHASAP